MKKCIVFIRVSTQSQNTESQKEALLKAAKSDGFKPSDIFIIENKESGYKLDETEREGINQMYELISKEKIDSVYIWELSRLSRKPKILYSIRDNLVEKKIQLICLNPQFSLLNNDRTTIDMTANIVFGIFGALTEQEIIEKRERFRRGKYHLASQNLFNGGKVPFGYKVEENGKRIIIDEEEERVLHEIFDLYEHGMSQAHIAKEMFERGNKRCTISFVHKMLTNIHLTGTTRKSKSATYPRTYPAIISLEQFNRCREIAQKNSTNLSKARYIYYANKLVKCKTCGCAWKGNKGKADYSCYNAYNVNAKYNGTPSCSNKSTISINVLDSLVWWVAIRLEEEYQYSTSTIQKGELLKQKEILNQKISTIEQRFQAIETKKQRLMSAYIDGLDESIYNKKKEEISNEKRTISNDEKRYKEQERHLDRLLLSIDESQNRFRHVKESIAEIKDDLTRQQIVQKHIEKIYIENKKIDYKFASFTEPKTANAREIEIYTYNMGKLTFYYIPNGNVWLFKTEDGHFQKLKIPYLDRYKDKSKIRIRAEEKEIKNSLEKKRIKEGRLTVSEAASMFNLSIATLYHAMQRNKLKHSVENKKKIILIEDLKNFLKTR